MGTRVKKWCFTVNNPLFCVDYYTTLSKDVRCLRFIFGVETGQRGTRHLQGYIEFKNPVRFTVVREVLSAHWEPAKGSSHQNFRYCSKDGEYQLFGNWDAEIKSCRNGSSSREKICYAGLVSELLSDSRSNAMVRPEYIRNKRNIDEIVSSVRELRVRHARYVELCQSRVSEWQHQCLIHINSQNRRKICWYYDTEGNKGKTFLAHLFYFIYQFDLFDGITSARDIALMISDDPRGFVIDVTRSNEAHFSYNTLEALKNGFVMTGKYQGIKRIFLPKPVIVFANFMPDTSKLSEDRWCIHSLNDVSSTPSLLHPLPVAPTPPPPLFETPQEVYASEQEAHSVEFLQGSNDP